MIKLPFDNKKVSINTDTILLGTLVGLGIILVGAIVVGVGLWNNFSSRLEGGSAEIKFRDDKGRIKNLRLTMDDEYDGHGPPNGPYGIRRASLPYWRA